MSNQSLVSTASFNKKTIFWAAMVYSACFIWFLFLAQGLPLGDLDDWALTLISKRTPWKELFFNLLLPWSKSAYWFNQVDLFDQIVHKRIVNGIVLKSISTFFGIHFFPSYIFAKGIFFSGTVTVVFILMKRVTQSVLFALAGTIFFALVPAHYAHVLWIADPFTIAQCFIVLSIWLFSEMILRLERNKVDLKFFLLLSSMFITGWLSIKSKEPGLIFPLVVGAYLLTNFETFKSRKLYFFLILSLASLIIFQIVPIEHLNSPVQSFTYRFSNISRILLRNYQVGYEDEPTTAFFSMNHIWPVSIARTFGARSLWVLIFFIFLYLVKLRAKSSADYFLKHPLVRICLLWVLIEIILMGFFQPEPRYFSGTMAPISLLVVRLVWCITSSKNRFWKYALLGISLFCWGSATFGMNLQHVIWLRLQIGSRSNRLFKTAEFLYLNVNHSLNASTEDVARFYCPAYVLDSNKHPRMEDVVYFAELYYESWNKTKDGSLVDFERFAKMGAIYYITYDANKFTNFQNVTLASVVTGINNKSFFESIVHRLKRKTPQPLYIFKYQKF